MHGACPLQNSRFVQLKTSRATSWRAKDHIRCLSSQEHNCVGQRGCKLQIKPCAGQCN